MSEVFQPPPCQVSFAEVYKEAEKDIQLSPSRRVWVWMLHVAMAAAVAVVVAAPIAWESRTGWTCNARHISQMPVRRLALRLSVVMQP